MIIKTNIKNVKIKKEKVISYFDESKNTNNNRKIKSL